MNGSIYLFFLLFAIVLLFVALDIMYRAWHERAEIQSLIDAPSSHYLFSLVPFHRHCWWIILRRNPFLLYHKSIRPE